MEHKLSQVKRLIVRYIRDNQLPHGAKMPAQTEMRQLFNTGVATLRLALDELRSQGMLAIRDKVGVFVDNPQSSGINSRRVGLLTSDVRRNASGALQNCHLQHALAQLDCRVTWFPQKSGSSLKLYNDFEDLPELREALQAGELDGVVSTIALADSVLQLCRAWDIPVLLETHRMHGDYMAITDYDYLITESVRVLKEAGFQRPELLFGSNAPEISELFLQRCREAHLEARKESVHTRWFRIDDMADNIAWAQEVFENWLARPSAARPDCLLIPDDILSYRLHLRLESTDWHPEILSLNNPDLNLPPLHTQMGYWVLDLQAKAHAVANYFLRILRKEPNVPHKLLIRPVFHSVQCFS
ncbi:MAG: GntR family transcriptional regulator [Victivallales bacterium]|nr:GntR family transcriptional regulator [Victivallales bacterium]